VKIIFLLDEYLHRIFRILMWKDFYVYSAAIFLLYILACSTYFDFVLRKDGYYYILKGMEAANGDFSLFRPHAFGWPLFLAFFYWLLNVDNIFQAMFLARWLSIILTCFTVVLLGCFCKKMCGQKNYEGACVVAVTAYVLSFHVQEIAKVAYTEPLFLVLTLSCYYFMVSSKPLNTMEIGLAALFAGLSYWVRANGLFQLFVLLTVIALWSYKDVFRVFKNSLFAVLVFFGVCAPYLLMRYLQFDSAFDYGPNSKYFVDNFRQVWDDTIPVPTFLEYLSTHNWYDYYNKFIEDGLLKIFHYMHLLFNLKYLWIILLVVSLLAAVVYKRRDMYAMILLFLLTFAGFSMIFQVFGHVRHLLFLIPFILACSVVFISSLGTDTVKISNIVFGLLLVSAVSSSEEIKLFDENHINVPQVKDTWALWAADNLEGNVALVEAGDILQMAQHYRKPAMQRVPESFALVEEKINRVRPGEHKSLAEALPDFQARNIDYVITDKRTLYMKHRRPYLKEIREEKWRKTFELLNSIPGGEPGGALIGVDIYKVHYE